MAEVIIDIDAQGNTKVESRGVKGAGCKALTAAIEAALGKTVTDQTTTEFFQKEHAHARAGGNRQ